jgi:hypothetical protein
MSLIKNFQQVEGKRRIFFAGRLMCFSAKMDEV